jgi:ABC-type amino acid transport system permease subunit
VISINYTSNQKQVRKILGIAGALLTLAIPYFIMLQNDNRNIEAEQSLCPFKLLTGFPCPGCGITKSLIFFYEGDFLKSIYYHLFGPFTFLFCILAIVVLTAELVNKKEYFQNVFYSKKIAYCLGYILAIYHLTRLIYFISTNNIDNILRQSIWQ